MPLHNPGSLSGRTAGRARPSADPLTHLRGTLASIGTHRVSDSRQERTHAGAGECNPALAFSDLVQFGVERPSRKNGTSHWRLWPPVLKGKPHQTLTDDRPRLKPCRQTLSGLQFKLFRIHVLRRALAGDRFRQLIDCICLSSEESPHLLNGAHQRSREHHRRILVDPNFDQSLKVT